VAYGIQPLIDRGTTGHGITVVLPEEAETGPARPRRRDARSRPVEPPRRRADNFPAAWEG